MNYATNTSLEDQVIQAEKRAALAARPSCGNCCTEFFSRVATTFCGDCGIDLCSQCAEKFAMETYCRYCADNARRVAAYPDDQFSDLT